MCWLEIMPQNLCILQIILNSKVKVRFGKQTPWPIVCLSGDGEGEQRLDSLRAQIRGVTNCVSELYLHVDSGGNCTPLSLHSLTILSFTFLHRSKTLKHTHTNKQTR